MTPTEWRRNAKIGSEMVVKYAKNITRFPPTAAYKNAESH
jgi:hypothetical protein